MKTAEDVFGELVASGHEFEDISNPQKSKVIKKFDPDAEEILAIPPLQEG